MSSQILSEVKRLLAVLEATQEKLTALFTQKVAALTGARAVELLRLAETEAELVSQLQSLLSFRRTILLRAKQDGLPCQTVAHLVDAAGDGEREALNSQIQRCRESSTRLRHESWIHWIIAHRAYNHHTELLDLIAHCGKKTPTYSRGPNQETLGGAILDASV